MEDFFGLIVKKRTIVLIVAAILTLISLWATSLVVINYDLTEYLPEDAGTKRAITVMRKEFSYPGTLQVMATDVSLRVAAHIKKDLKEIPGIKSVLWLDDVTDTTKPIEFIPKDLLKDYYRNGSALFQIEFIRGDYAKETSLAIEKIEDLYPNLILSGNAQNSRHMKEVLNREVFKIIAIVLPICLAILLAASTSWIEPFIYLAVIGVSVAINMGTNSLFKGISFITNSIASLLQLAISMDYSIFLMHRYYEERDKGLAPKDAVIKASQKTISSISASALTTIAGFIALVFMRHGIGKDIGLVLAKGIVISLGSVVVLLPSLIMVFNELLEKTRHKSFLPSFQGLGKIVIRFRTGIIILAALIIVPSMLAQTRNEFLYGDASALQGEGKVGEDRQRIMETFGANNPIIVLIPKNSLDKEVALVDELENQEGIRNVISTVTLGDNAISPSFIPESIRQNFESKNYNRLILNLDIEGENPENFEAVERVRSILESHYPGTWLAAGMATSLTDIRDTVTKDSMIVTIISLLAVGIIILIAFRSISIPLILLLSIQGAVWINMAFPYFMGFKMDYLGYLVISSLQLGATIDYGILLTSRYLEARKDLDPREAAIESIRTAGTSILVSALILAAAGFGFGWISRIDSISQLGILIGRGALISCAMTLVLLPALLIVSDKLIFKAPLKNKA